MFGTSNRAVIIADDAFIRIIRIVQANGCNTKKDEPRHDKTNKVTVRPAKTDQPGHPPSLIRVIAVRMKKAWVLSYSLSA